ncbi:MAG: hypothetical protein COV60_02105 [Candidatus Magasanikbacteria bacterium CG11_big_fil_rev_8_21_14_0_20_43_7]|uniref:Methyltransferase domain-containing protein n=1 Tax=Candidatus Magasanikbacteria bacterium CG11_big_fil_rev_8_21_14_0_20_43_7 TaxID=1974654 RepID=A0A2H0N2G4_9BACT|nr:MAG: hypothetical protein COV60_02105 [Candidatus Magasanikbacteria bacterium CG11_big_fil_rev_8_21_14_0_20_43_7]
MANDYDKLFREYQKTHTKPDKQYSMLPTVLKLASPLKDKVAVDVGCGDGFFSFAFAKKAKKVYGIDNEEKQIDEAKKHALPNTQFNFSDMLDFNYPKSDVVNIPFVLGYIPSPEPILKLFQKIHASLNKNGKVVGIIDAPKANVHDNKIFGSVKKIKSFKEGAKLKIELYDDNKKIVTLNAYYYTKETIEHLLDSVGFTEIQWHKPIISKTGIKKHGLNFWKKYLNNLDVAYFTAKKL